MNLLSDLRVALRSLARVKGLTLTVILTLALGIGANAAIFSVVRGVLLRPLVNRDEDRLIYIRQSAPGIGIENATFSVPEINDLRAQRQDAHRVRRLLDHRLHHDRPRRAARGARRRRRRVVLRRHGPAPGAGPAARPDRRRAGGRRRRGADPPLLDHRAFSSDPSVLGKTVRLGDRSAIIVGVLEPSVPYPAETEIIANVVTSPHHLDATMVHGRVHRMTELFGRLAPGADLEAARAELRTAHQAILEDHPEAYPKEAHFRIDACAARPDRVAGADRAAGAARRVGAGLRHRLLERRQPDPRALGAPRGRARDPRGARRGRRRAAPDAARREPAAVRRRARSSACSSRGRWSRCWRATPSRFSVRALDLTVDASLLWVGVALALIAAVLLAFVPRLPSAERARARRRRAAACASRRGTNRRLRVFAVTQIAASFVLLAGAGMLLATLVALQTARTGFDTRNVLAMNVPVISFARPPRAGRGVLQGGAAPHRASCRASSSVAVGTTVPWRDAGGFGPGFQFSVEGYAKANGEEDPRARFRTVSPGFFAALGVPIIAGRDFDGRRPRATPSRS